ncbi:MAG: glucans biosynthesis glucosyltransferase MdoH [Hyphomicrobiales bacterium]
MSQNDLSEPSGAAFDNRAMTPAGLQTTASLANRRRVGFALNILSYMVILGALANVLGVGGWSVIDILLMVSFAVVLPWSVLGFWNSLIGFLLLRFVKNPLDNVAPFARAGDRATAITLRTAIILTLRNEDPFRAIARLKTIKASLDRTGLGDHFSYFILSDTSDPLIAREEQLQLSQWQAMLSDPGQVVYRRRQTNTGFKAGNIRAFCDEWGDRFDLMLPLDADSLMAGDTIVKLVRIMQAYPKIGILQSLVVGMPSESAFGRLFQFGMRHGMRPYTMGSAWWLGDCGPFWGHNAVVRIEPFRVHCRLPVLAGTSPLSGYVLSHDQVEASLMRRGGYEVRVLPEEGGSWEDNPPSVIEFVRRDLRWCQGNLQYLKLYSLPALQPTSRFQLLWAISMFVGIPFWTLIIFLCALKPLDTEDLVTGFPSSGAFHIYAGFLALFLSPKLFGFLDVIFSRHERYRYGGLKQFSVGVVCEIIFAFLLGAITTLHVTIFVMALALGRSIGWAAQTRDIKVLPAREALKNLWPHLVFGAAVTVLMAVSSSHLLLASLPLTLGYVVAIPFAVLTSSPRFGRYLSEHCIASIPEERDIPPEIVMLRAGGPDASRLVR